MTVISNYNKGTKYLLANNNTKALQFLKRETEVFKELYLNLGNAYKGLGDDTKASEYFILACSESVPDSFGKYYTKYVPALNNLGMLAYASGDDYMSEEFYRVALSADPLHYEALWNLHAPLLRRYFSGVGSMEDWKLGWAAYEYRFKRRSGAVKIDTTIPRWDGVSSGTDICVLTEQGIGDKIMFGRYLKLLEEKFNTINVVCHPSLDCFYSEYNIVRSAVGTCSVPICSLAGIFDCIPDCNYLDGKFLRHEFSGNRKKIGVVWAGSDTHANNANRSVPSRYFSDLADLGDLYSLNPGSGNAKHITTLNSPDWSTTASYLLGLDLVISVDTSIVHLAGTLGVPTLLLQPLKETDFRWGHLVDNPWYPSVKAINNPASWDAVFKEVRSICTKVL